MNPTTATNRSDGIPPDGSAGFRTTHWSVVLAAGERSLPSAQDALARLCQEYWYPLYAHVRRRGHGAHEAQDLTQAFFARLLEKNSIQAADKERGRFRSFLLASLNNFLNNEWHRNQTARRGGGSSIISWDAQTAEERYVREPSHELTAEKIYERRWAFTLLEHVMEELRAEYSVAGKEQLFEQLQVSLSGSKGTESYAELAQKLNMSEGAVKVAVHRLRQRYGRLLRGRIAHTVGNEAEVEDELRRLFAALD